MLKVTDVDYVKDYELLLTFNDGTRKLVDLKPYLTGEVFGELLDLDKFTQYGLTGYTIEWANGADLAPEFLQDNLLGLFHGRIYIQLACDFRRIMSCGLQLFGCC